MNTVILNLALVFTLLHCKGNTNAAVLRDSSSSSVELKPPSKDLPFIYQFEDPMKWRLQQLVALQQQFPNINTMQYTRQFRNADRDASIAGGYQDDRDIFVTIPQLLDIINNKRRTTSAFLQTASNVLTNVAADILPNENSGIPTPSYNPYTNPRINDRMTSSQSDLFNPFPVVIVNSPQNQFPINPVHQGFVSPLSQNTTQQNFVPKLPPLLPSHSLFPIITTTNTQISSGNNHNQGPVQIPVASGGVAPPNDYNPNNQMVILNHVPWLDRVPTNQPLANNVPVAQGNIGLRPNRNENKPSQSNNFGSSQTALQSSQQGFGNGENVFSVIDGIQEFTLDLISTFRALKISGNIVYSPVSITSLLSLLTLGTKGETKHEIEVALNLPGQQSSDSQHRQYEDILRRLNHESAGISISTSSRLFMEERIPVYGSFTDKAALHYNCTVSLESFRRRPVQTQNRVNRWVENETHGKIKNFIERPFNPQTLFVAVNTIFFKGDWKTPFPEYFTGPRDFDTGNKVKRVQMMTNVFKTHHYFSRSMNVDIVSIPYSGDEFAMFIIVPRESPQDRPIQAVESQLDTFIIDDLIHNMTFKDVSVSLPKMRMAMKTSLTKSLSQLNIERIFSRSLADFSGLTNTKPLWVSEVLHEAVIEINEVGTVAAAASAATMDRFGGFDRVNVNKPAIIFIRDLRTGIPLFWTRLMEPESLE